MALLGGWRLTRAGVLFVIGILVLGGLVTGGVFLVKNHGEAVRRDQAVKIAEQNLKDQSQTATQPTNTTDSSNTDTTSQTNTDTTTGGTSTATTGTGAAALPETGVDSLQLIERLVVIAMVTFSITSYVVSRRVSRSHQG